jgi:regulator of replication initiation timing
MDIITSIGTSITLAKRLREISKNIEDAEFKNLLADLSSELSDLKLEAASLKERLATLQEENALLKETAQPVNEKPIGRKWGCYQFEGDDGLYCPACWDSKRKKSSTTRVSSQFRLCSVCRAPLGAG